jgi:high-affinity Fe2+/Pb2+ permease
MICGSGFALAVWDLILLDGALGTSSSGEQTRRYENKHLQSLALALGAGLLLAFLGGVLNLQIPFVAMMLLVALVIFGFDRIWSTIKKRSTQ